MPELPEVETIARGLDGLVGKRISEIEVGPHDWVRSPPPSPAAHLVGRRIAAVRRHGKRLHLRLDPAGEIVVHLGMSGQVTLHASGEPVAPHTHLRVRFAKQERELRFRDPRRFGGAWIRPVATSAADAGGPGPLGPDALEAPLAELRAALARRRQVKALLLDQRAVSGVGNIYCDEALFAARIHPLTPAADLSPEQVRELLRHLRRILRASIRHGGSTLRDYRDAEGRVGAFRSRHRVYGREGEPCPRCGARIARILAAGRSTHLCRRCQRAPRKRRV